MLHFPSKRKEDSPMNKIKTALQDLAEVIEKIEAVERVKIAITLKKPKSSKTEKPKSK